VSPYPYSSPPHNNLLLAADLALMHPIRSMARKRFHLFGKKQRAKNNNEQGEQVIYF
jgi:hypothetical protein